MPHADPELGKPELLPDLLDRLAAQKLEADLRAVDRAVTTYHRKLAGLEPWETFIPPEPARKDDEVIHRGKGRNDVPPANRHLSLARDVSSAVHHIYKCEAAASSLGPRPGAERGRGEPGR